MKFTCVQMLCSVALLASSAHGLSLMHGAFLLREGEVAKKEFTEQAYQEVAALQDDGAMITFIRHFLASHDKFVPSAQDEELAGLAPWFSGTKATQSLQQLKAELAGKSWVKDLRALRHSRAGLEFTEDTYKEVASFKDDAAMSEFVRRLLHSEHKFVPDEEEKELSGFVPWYSGTKATQTLERMRAELFTRPWVKEEVFSATETQGKAGLESQEEESPDDEAASSEDQVEEEASSEDQEEGEDEAEGSSSDNEASEDQEEKETVSALQRKKESFEVPIASDASCSECIMIGASHILPFNSFRKRIAQHPKQEAAFREKGLKESGALVAQGGAYWLVNSPSIQIQARFDGDKLRHGSTNLTGIAVSGSFVGDNVLLISPLSGKVTWNDEEVLKSTPCGFANEFVMARFRYQSELIRNGKKAPGTEFVFSNGLSLVVNRWNHLLAARIHMCESHVAHAKLSGHCGTFVRNQKENQMALRVLKTVMYKVRGDEVLFPDE